MAEVKGASQSQRYENIDPRQLEKFTRIPGFIQSLTPEQKQEMRERFKGRQDEFKEKRKNVSERRKNQNENQGQLNQGENRLRRRDGRFKAGHK